MTIFFHRRRKRKSTTNSEMGQPYIIVVKNKSNKTYPNINIFDRERREAIEFSFGTPNITYRQFINSLQMLPIITDFVRIIASPKQLLIPVVYESVGINSQTIIREFPVQLDAYAQQLLQRDIHYSFLINYCSKIRFDILPHETVKILIYPAKKPQFVGCFGKASAFYHPHINAL